MMDIYLCEICHAKFRDIDKYTDHKNTLSIFGCSYCDYLFHTPHDVGSHIFLRHSAEVNGQFQSYLYPEPSVLAGSNEESRDKLSTINQTNFYLSDKSYYNYVESASNDELVNKLEAGICDPGDKGGRTTKPTVLFLISESSQKKQKRKGDHPRKWMKLGSENSAIKDKGNHVLLLSGNNTAFSCKHCKRSFTKERHFLGHKCMAKGDYVDSLKQVDSEEEKIKDEDDDDDDDDAASGESDIDFTPEKPSTNAIDFYYHAGDASDDDDDDYDEQKDVKKYNRLDMFQKRIIRRGVGRGRGRKDISGMKLVVVEDMTPLEFESSDKAKEEENELNKENHSEVTEQDDDMEEPDTFQGDKYYVPVFSTEEERLAVEEQVNNIDLSIVDNMYSKRKSAKISSQKVPYFKQHEYICNVCLKVFNKKPKIRRHCLTHTDLKPFRCPRCDLCFNTKCNLYSHMRKHTGNYFKCSKCDFQTCYRTQIARHEATHSVIRLVCKLCENNYSTLRCLEKHVSRMHTDSEGLQYLETVKAKQSMLHTCPICKRKFKSKINRDRHQIVHNNSRSCSSTEGSMFSCRLCSYSSSKHMLLEAHFKKHRLVYVCCMCFNIFPSATSLRNHLKDHASVSSPSITQSSIQLDESSILNPPDIQLIQAVQDKIVQIRIPECESDAHVSKSKILTDPDADSELKSISEGSGNVFPEHINSISSHEHENAVCHVNIMVNQASRLHEKRKAVHEDDSSQSEGVVGVIQQEPVEQNGTRSVVQSTEILQNPNSAGDSDSLFGASDFDVDSAIAAVINSVKLSNRFVQCQDAARDEQELGGTSDSSGGTNLDALFQKSINYSWYVPEPDGSLLAYYHISIPDDLVERSADSNKSGGVPVQSSKKNSNIGILSSEEVEKLSKLPPDVSPVISENYKPLTEKVYEKIQEAFGDCECEHCGRRYHNKCDLERHIFSHMEDKPFKCSLCSYSSATKDSLKRHKETNHEGKKYHCKDCDFYALSKGALWHHRKKHTVFLGKCPICSQQLSSSNALRPHILTEHPEISRKQMLMLVGSYYQVSGRFGRRSYKCPYCSRIFHSSVNVKKHIWIHEGIRPFKCPHCKHCCRSRNNLNMHMLTHSNEKPHQCPDCEKSYKCKQALRLHRQATHEKNLLFMCDKCDYKAAQKANMKRHMETHERKSYSCDQCDYTTSQICYFKRHKESHEGKLIYSCEICDYNTSHKFYLRKHMEIHIGKITYCCDLCDYTTPRKTEFRKHQEAHEGKSFFHCNKCEYSTTQKHYMARHMEIHETKQFYSCDKCDYNATQKYHLRRHLETHEANEVYNCEECEYTTQDKADFKNHVLTHDGKLVYTCDKCNHTTTEKWRLKRHMKIHDLNRLYSCEQCSFSTNVKVNFKKHMDAHAGRVTYSCYKCDFSTSVKEELKVHMSTHEKEMLYSCDKCDYTTNQKFYFTRHIENHEGKILHTCDRCDYNTIYRNHLRRHMETHEGHMVYACDKCDYSATDKSDLKRHVGMHRITQQFVCEYCSYSSNTLKIMKAHYGRKHKEKIFNISAITANFEGLEGGSNKIFKCISCSCTFENVSELKDHIQSKHGLSLESLDFDPDEGIQIEIVTDAETGDEMVEETMEPNPDAGIANLQNESNSIHSEQFQDMEVMEMDDKTASEVDLIQQILKQGVLDSQLTLQAVDNDGQLVAVNPEAIIVQEDGQEVVLDGDYVIQYVSHDSGETQGSEATLQEVVLESAE